MIFQRFKFIWGPILLLGGARRWIGHFFANLEVLKNFLEDFLKSNFIKSFLEGGWSFLPNKTGVKNIFFTNPKVPKTMVNMVWA